jgi:hypothetical protein
MPRKTWVYSVNSLTRVNLNLRKEVRELINTLLTWTLRLVDIMGTSKACKL